MSILQRIRKKAASIIHPGTTGQSVFLRNTSFPSNTGEFDYQGSVGAGLRASVVMAPVQWIQRSMPEAPLVVEKQVGEDEWEKFKHPLTDLVEKPNPFYSGTHLWSATVFSYTTAGNAYWIILKNNLGKPVEIWYAPHWTMRPITVPDSGDFISHYEYNAGGRIQIFQPDEILHFRHGIDPSNPRLGISPLGSALKEIFTDMEAAEFIASLLRNGGVPGIILSPKESDAMVTAKDANDVKEYVMEKTTGSHRGEPLVFSQPVNVEKLAYSPNELDLTPASDRSEERVSALLGIPAAVVGFSAGLEQTKVGATMAELRKLAWQNGIFPIQRVFSSEVSQGLLPLYGETSATLRTIFDTSKVAALQEDRNKLAMSLDRGVKGGWILVSEAKRKMGFEVTPADDVYLRPVNIIPVPVDQGDKVLVVETPKGFKALKQGNHNHSLFEERISNDAERSDATKEETAFINHQEREEPRLRKLFEADLIKFFQKLGRNAESVSREILGVDEKQSLEDQITAERIQTAMGMSGIIPIFEEIYEQNYLLIAKESTGAGMVEFGLSTNIPDPVARAVQVTGGTRSGLVDLSQQTKDALFKAIEEGRALGEGAEALSKRIAQLVESGPWSTVETRAMVIARTETKHAQRISALHMGKANDAQQFRVFDARLGITDPICESLDGTLVSFQEAEQLANEEHPNGTRDFVPRF